MEKSKVLGYSREGVATIFMRHIGLLFKHRSDFVELIAKKIVFSAQ